MQDGTRGWYSDLQGKNGQQDRTDIKIISGEKIGGVINVSGNDKRYVTVIVLVVNAAINLPI